MMIRGYRVHCCLLNLVCWAEWWSMGAPMRLHLGERHWTFLDGRRRRRIWGYDEKIYPNQHSGISFGAPTWTGDDTLTEPEIRERLDAENWQPVTATATPPTRTWTCEHVVCTGPLRMGVCPWGCDMREVTA